MRDGPGRREAPTAFKVLLAAVLCGWLIVVATPNARAAHTLPYSSVDNREIRYNLSSRYGSTSIADGINSWNSRVAIDYKPDTPFVVADVLLSDYNDPGDGFCGIAFIDSGGDQIYFNISYFDRVARTYEHSCVTHEMGHSYGLGDHGSSYWNDPSVMDDCPVCEGTGDIRHTIPTSHDLADYRSKWG